MAYSQPEEPLVERLKADATLDGLVGGRVWPRWSVQDPDDPLIVCRRESAERSKRLDGSSSLGKYTVRLECYAATEAATHAPLAAAWAALDGWRDHAKGVQGVFHEDDDTGEDDASGLKFTARILTVWFFPVA